MSTLTKPIVSKHEKVLFFPPDRRLMNFVPSDHRFVKHPKYGKLLVLPYTHEVTRLGRNLGFRIAAPIMHHYKWRNTTPWKTQKITAALLTMHRRAYVLSEMGTGKTRSTLFALDYLLQEGDIECALVVAPVSTLSNVWDREVFEYFSHLSVGVLYGTKARRERVLEAKHDIYVINHDGVKVVGDALARKGFGAIVVDEAAAYRNKSTDRWKSLNKILKDVPYAWALTGSPTPNEPTDAWGLAQMFTPNTVPRFFKQFQRQTMTQVSQFRYVPKKDAVETVYEVLQPAVRYRREDCVELPPVSFQDVEVEMGTEQKKVYDEMMKTATVMFKEGKVKAVNEGVLFSKLLQIASGWVYTKDKNIVALDNQNRLNQLLEIIEQSLGKVLVFADFIHAAQSIHKWLLAKKVDCALVTGQTSKSLRDDIFGTFQRAESPRVLVAHPKCMAHGLTLTAANTIVWFTPTVQLETYEQACARITRPGQKHKQLVLHLTGTAVERKIYGRLRQKAQVQGALLEMFNDN